MKQRARRAAAATGIGVLFATPLVAASTNAEGETTTPSTTTETTPPPVDWQAKYEAEHKLARKRLRLLRKSERRAYRQTLRLRRRWRPTVEYAFTLAAAVYGIPRWQLRNVGWCESRLDVFAANGPYLGVMQLGWRPFGLSPYDPIANVLSAAQTVKHDGSWRQWQCKP